MNLFRKPMQSANSVESAAQNLAKKMAGLGFSKPQVTGYHGGG